MKEDGVECEVGLGVGEDDDAEIFLGNQHDTSDEAGDAAGVADELAALIVSQPPTHTVAGEMRLKVLEFVRSFADRDNHLLRPHGVGGFFAEDAVFSAGNLAAIELEEHPLGHVGDGRVDGAGGTGVIEIFEGDDLEFAIDSAVFKPPLTPYDEVRQIGPTEKTILDVLMTETASLVSAKELQGSGVSDANRFVVQLVLGR